MSLKWEQNHMSKLHSMMTHILIFWFKESTERRKTSFLKETVEYADLHKAVLKKTMTTQVQCIKYDFVTPLIIAHKEQQSIVKLLYHAINQIRYSLVWAL